MRDSEIEWLEQEARDYEEKARGIRTTIALLKARQQKGAVDRFPKTLKKAAKLTAPAYTGKNKIYPVWKIVKDTDEPMSTDDIMAATRASGFRIRHQNVGALCRLGYLKRTTSTNGHKMFVVGPTVPEAPAAD